MAREFELRRVQGPWTQPHSNFVVETRRLNLATVVRTSLYALPGPIAYPVGVTFAIALLGTLRGKWLGRLRLSDSALGYPGFVRNTLAEMLGLGVAMTVADDYGWDGRGPQSLDSLRQYWGERGARPDLLFTRGGDGLQFVGEAKGRFLDQVRTTAPHADERAWIDKLTKWYGAHALQHFLVVAMADPSCVVANVYDPGEPREVYPPEALVGALRSRESLLWDSAPVDGVQVGENLIRGRWTVVPDDQPDDVDETSSVFVGVSDSEFEAGQEREGDDVQLSVAGRVIVVLRRGNDRSPPTLDSVSDYVANDLTLEIRRGGAVIGRGVLLANRRFRVLAGSESRPLQASALDSDRRTREQLVRIGVLDASRRDGVFQFLRNWEANSPSAAARVVLGTAADGPGEWQTRYGVPLRLLA